MVLDVRPRDPWATSNRPRATSIPILDMGEAYHAPMIEQRWMLTDEAADYLGVRPVTLRKWCREGLIPVHRFPGSRIYRFHAAELDAALGLDVEAAKNWGFTDEGAA